MDPLTPPARPRLATLWLGGCAGCHMSLLDLDEALLDVLARVELVYGPLVDAKTFPADVDVTLVEGAVAAEDHVALVRGARARTRVLVALGDCAVAGNVTALRNALGGPAAVLTRVFGELADGEGVVKTAAPPTSATSALPLPSGERAGERGAPPLTRLLDRVLPVHHVVHVDAFLPGCPPAPGDILRAIEVALAGAAAGRR